MSQGRSAIRRSFFQKVGDFLGRLAPQRREEKDLNYTHDLAENRGLTRAEPNDVRAALLGLEEGMASIVRRMDTLDDRLRRLEIQSEEIPAKDRPPRNPTRVPEQPKLVSQLPVRKARQTTWKEEDDLEIEPPGYTDPIFLREDAAKPTRAAATSGRTHVGHWEVESFERLLCEALGEQSSTGLEIDSLLTDLQTQLGSAQIETIAVGGQQQVVVLLPPHSQEGFAVVIPGGLADSEVVKFFNVDFGRRIFGCRQPALVVRDGNGFSVLRKGTVESS